MSMKFFSALRSRLLKRESRDARSDSAFWDRFENEFGVRPSQVPGRESRSWWARRGGTFWAAAAVSAVIFVASGLVLRRVTDDVRIQATSAAAEILVLDELLGELELLEDLDGEMELAEAEWDLLLTGEEKESAPEVNHES